MSYAHYAKLKILRITKVHDAHWESQRMVYTYDGMYMKCLLYEY
jgi:hypothetical protein